MSDEKLRELERRFKETGSVEDEAAWLKERVRVGDLTQERLEFAAYCGHEGARRASCGDPSPIEAAPEDLRAWFARLLPLSREAVARANIAHAAHLVASSSDSALTVAVEEAIAAASSVLACPCPADYRRAARAHYQVDLVGPGMSPEGVAAAMAEWDSRFDLDAWERWEPVPGIDDAVSLAAQAALGAVEACEERAEPADLDNHQHVKAAISAELAQWALRGA